MSYKSTAIYARVSTRGQEPKTQLRELRTYAKRRNLRVVHELVDYESGAKDKRPELEKLLDLVRKRQIDVVLVWKFDRFARSTKQLVSALEEFHDLGVDFVSYTENVDTSTAAGKALFAVVSAFAEFERDLIRERVRAGLDRAQAEGTRLGRPPIDDDTIVELNNARYKLKWSVRKIARETGLSVGTVSKYTARQSLAEPKP